MEIALEAMRRENWERQCGRVEHSKTEQDGHRPKKHKQYQVCQRTSPRWLAQDAEEKRYFGVHLIMLWATA